MNTKQKTSFKVGTLVQHKKGSRAIVQERVLSPRDGQIEAVRLDQMIGGTHWQTPADLTELWPEYAEYAIGRVQGRAVFHILCRTYASEWTILPKEYPDVDSAKEDIKVCRQQAKLKAESCTSNNVY